MAILPKDQETLSQNNKRRRTRRRRRRRSSSNSFSDASSTSSNNSNSQRKETPQLPPLSLEQQQQYIAIDCEMVGVGPHGCTSALARVTAVDWNLQTVYDAFVRPPEPVTDYRTFVSGITAADLGRDTGAIDLETCRGDIASLLRGKILVGHALKNDLHALGVAHPWQNTRDTAKYEPFMKTVRRPCPAAACADDDGIALLQLGPRKLSELCRERLNLEIQQPGRPHSAREDAAAALRLYRSVRGKWEKVMTYKMRKTASIEQQQQQQQQEKEQQLVATPTALEALPVASAA